MSDYPDTPITREEQYLAAGLDGGELPDPITREEQYLYEIATKMQSGGGSSLQSKSVTVTQNGTQNITPDSGYDGLSSVAVTTNVPASMPVLETLTVTENNTYTPGPGVDGFNEVIVEVEGGGGSVLVASKTVEDGYVAYTFAVDVSGYAVGAIPGELSGLGINMSFNGKIPIAMMGDTTNTLTRGYFDGGEYLFDTSSIPENRFPSAIYAVPIA